MAQQMLGGAQGGVKTEAPAAGANPDTKFCQECGSRVQRVAKFCPECGHKQ
jgi:membrane protease subunit (stomatin/prohibitin family)